MSRDSLYLCSLLYEKPFYLAVPVALHSLFSEKPHGERQGRGQNLPTALWPSPGFWTWGLAVDLHFLIVTSPAVPSPLGLPGMLTVPAWGPLTQTPSLASDFASQVKNQSCVSHAHLKLTHPVLPLWVSVIPGCTAFLYQGPCWTVRGHYSSYPWSLNAGFIMFMTSLCLGEIKMEREMGLIFHHINTF